ncbi:MAG: hypothetical protein RSD99_27220, partial [Janthinobacterium sp.]
MTNNDSNSPTLAEVAERYVKLVLAMGQHDASYVDAYYGPPAWQQEAVEQQLSLSDIKAATDKALALLADEPCLRAHNLRKQLHAVLAKADMLQGARLDFDTESARLYDAVSPHHSRAYYEALVAQIDALLPGPGTVSARVNALRAQLVIPADKLRAVMDAAIRMGRERTLQYIALPDDEDFVLEFVTDKPWSGYNWYKGNYQSVIQIN